MTALFTRRAVMAALAAIPAASSARAAGGIAVIDWGLLETCLAIGIVPAAATELRQFRQIAVEPTVPSSVADLGLRGAPNMELLELVAPEMILISGFYEYQRPVLERISKVVSLPIYEAGRPPFVLVEKSTIELGALTGHQVEAEKYIADTHAEIQAARARLVFLRDRPVFTISLGDSRHFRAFGADSMFGDVLLRLGLKNAWSDPTSYSAAAPVSLEALARVPEASIAVVAPLPPEVRRALPENALWNALPAVKEGRVAMLDPINHFGALPSARRFARLLAKGFEAGSNAD